MAALNNGIVSIEVPTQSSYRKQAALTQVKKLYPESTILQMDICDAIMIGEKKG